MTSKGVLLLWEGGGRDRSVGRSLPSVFVVAALRFRYGSPPRPNPPHLTSTNDQTTNQTHTRLQALKQLRARMEAQEKSAAFCRDRAKELQGPSFNALVWCRYVMCVGIIGGVCVSQAGVIDRSSSPSPHHSATRQGGGGGGRGAGGAGGPAQEDAAAREGHGDGASLWYRVWSDLCIYGWVAMGVVGDK